MWNVVCEAKMLGYIMFSKIERLTFSFSGPVFPRQYYDLSGQYCARRLLFFLQI